MLHSKFRWIVALLVLSASFHVSATAVAADSEPSAEEIIEQDRERIRRHLRAVEKRLRAKDVHHLSPELQRARERNLDRLHTYWKQGEFPHNDVTKQQRPIFIDSDGRECAVAHLMEKSGWEEEAEAVSRRENLAYIAEMESPEVVDWVEQSGLTAKEAAMIQPTYCHLDVGYGDDCNRYDTGHVGDTATPSEDTATSEDTSESETGTSSWSDASDDGEDRDDGENADRACAITGTPQLPGSLLFVVLLAPALVRRRCDG